MARFTKVLNVQNRIVALHLHIYREAAVAAALSCIETLTNHDIKVALRTDQLEFLAPLLPEVELLDRDLVPDCELVVVFGGDGTILRAAEWALARDIPLLGVNLGHVGFLAELESSEIAELTRAVIARTYSVEERMTVDVSLYQKNSVGLGEILWESFAINEVSIEKSSPQRMVDILVEIDERPFSHFSTDGILVASPTGSTAYAFSAQGPVLWPDLSALLLVPICAHALFARPMVLSPKSQIKIKAAAVEGNEATLSCDGRRSIAMRPGMIAHIQRGKKVLKLARTNEQPFVDRLVRKFRLPVTGWRQSDEAGKC